MNAMPSEEPELITVQNADYMDAEMFRKHMAKRHPESLVGRGWRRPFATEYIEDCYRTFHDTIHRLSLYGDMDHDHGA